jgi:hypothetical protein
MDLAVVKGAALLDEVAEGGGACCVSLCRFGLTFFVLWEREWGVEDRSREPSAIGLYT